MSFFDRFKAPLGQAAGGAKSVFRWIIMKTIGVLLAVVFIALAVLFLSYSLIATVTSVKGKEVSIVSVSDQVGKWTTGSRIGGLFVVSTETGKGKSAVKDEKIYSLYPVWPDVLKPAKGDALQVWPAKQPLVGAPRIDGWGWFIVGTLLILGLVMLEFAFLVLTIR